jgi:hypothetical protein
LKRTTIVTDDLVRFCNSTQQVSISGEKENRRG